MDQGKCDVAADDHAPLPRQPLGKALRNRADAGDRHGAQRDTGDENIKPADATTQLAQGKFQEQQRRAAAGLPLWDVDRPHGAASSGTAVSTRPDRSRTTRSQRAASAGSWVTRTSVV